jgi:hypothetical protein
MEARELVRASGKCMMPVHIKLQMTIGAHSPSGIHRVLKVSLQLGREQMRLQYCILADRSNRTAKKVDQVSSINIKTALLENNCV